MVNLPNPLRDRFERERENREGDKPESIRDRLGRGMGTGPARRTSKGDMLRLAIVGLLLIVVIGGLVVAKMYELTPGSKTAEERPGVQRPTIATTTEDDLRWDGMHLQFKDGPDPVDVNSDAFGYFIEAFKRQYTPEKIRELAQTDHKSLLDRWEKANQETSRFQETTVNRMMWDYSNVCRGKFFKIRGRLIRIYPEVINRTNPSGVKDMWMCVVQDMATYRPIHFYTLEKPKAADGKPFAWKKVKDGIPENAREFEVVDSAWCEIEGVFLKSRPFESEHETRKGFEKREAAILFAGTFRELPPPIQPSEIGKNVAIGVALVAVVLGVVVLICVLAARRHAKAGDMRLKMALSRIQRNKSAEGDAGDWKSIEE
jgi:hypothetical protein